MSKEKDSSPVAHPSSLIPRIKRALRGEVDARTLALEAMRRTRVSLTRRRERAQLDRLDQQPARLHARFASLSGRELLLHFRERRAPRFLPGLNAAGDNVANLQRAHFPTETKQLIKMAERVAGAHCWELLGFGEKCFGAEINWCRDPLSGFEWPLVYHADITYGSRNDGSDVRVLWELNRLSHFITLGRAYAVTGVESFAAAFFHQLMGWREQNPVGRGANWSCAMEVALRAMNLLAALSLFRNSAELYEERLAMLLSTLNQHGAHIRRNLEFSYVGTSNHYLSDVVGLLWLGLMLPELEEARAWREFALRETLSEMDKQVLADGADFESSTGYHRFVTELFLYSFILCRENEIEIEERYWLKLRSMIEYVRAILRPDGRAPLVGDTDSGQVLPVMRREADDHAYLLALGAAVFNEPRFKNPKAKIPEELLWVLGEEGFRRYRELDADTCGATSEAFADAGSYVLRRDDLYLLFAACGAGVNGRGSHGHNDALSLEVSACNVSFIVDPGTYVYTADLAARNLFRSTCYHSTVEVDETEQNTTNPLTPFVIGDEARPRLLLWETGPERDRVAAEHRGYNRLPEALTHKRAVLFDKQRRFWLVEDTFDGPDPFENTGRHTFRFRFQLAHALEVSLRSDKIVRAHDRASGARLFIASLNVDASLELEECFASNDYGMKRPALCALWTMNTCAPFDASWAIIPVCPGDDESERLELIEHLRLPVNLMRAHGL